MLQDSVYYLLLKLFLTLENLFVNYSSLRLKKSRKHSIFPADGKTIKITIPGSTSLTLFLRVKKSWSRDNINRIGFHFSTNYFLSEKILNFKILRRCVFALCEIQYKYFDLFKSRDIAVYNIQHIKENNNILCRFNSQQNLVTTIHYFNFFHPIKDNHDSRFIRKIWSIHLLIKLFLSADYFQRSRFIFP